MTLADTVRRDPALQKIRFHDILLTRFQLIRMGRIGLPVIGSALLPLLIRIGASRLEAGSALAPWIVVADSTALSAQMLLILAAVALATAIAGQYQSGLTRERLLTGQRETTQLSADLLLVPGGCLIVQLSVVVAINLGGLLDWTVTGGGPHDDVSIIGLVPDAAGGMAVATIMSAAVGLLIGMLSRRALTASAVCLVLTVLSTQSQLALDSIPGLTWLYAASPAGPLLLSGQGAPIQSTGVFAVAGLALLGWPLAALVVTRRVLTSRLSPDRPRSGRQRLRPAVRWPVAVAALLVVGFFVPVGLRSQIPWPLRPQWRLDVANHRTSLDVATEFVGFVRAGKFSDADTLTDGASSRSLIGAYLRQVRTGDAPALSIQQRTGGDPGTVQVDLRAGGFALCEQRFVQGWRIVSVSLTGECPPAKLR